MRRRGLVSPVLAALALAACGGGGPGASDPIGPPTALRYAAPAVVYESGTPIPPNLPVVAGGVADLFSIEPPLPTGLALDPGTGVITGTPGALSAATDHAVTASNAMGSAVGTVRIEVVASLAESLEPRASFGDAEILHLLSRTHFGGTAEEEEAVRAVGVPAYVDAIVRFEADPALDAAAFLHLKNRSDDPGLPGGFPDHSQVARWWLHRMLHTDQPFQEVLALFWHDHFAASTAPIDSSQTSWMVAMIDLLRREGAGNLRDLLLAVARDPMMLQWLDGVLNRRGEPNENFAREFWELFTLGADQGYTQNDIVEAARAFTGYRKRYHPTTGQQFVEWDPARHDTDAKNLLGETIPAQSAGDDYAAVADLTLRRRPVAEYICRKIFEHFCHRDPTDVPIARMAEILRGADYDLGTLLAALFKSEAFYSARSRAGLVKGPVEQVVGFLRQTGLVPVDFLEDWDAPDGAPNTLKTLDWVLDRAAQRVTQPPSVNGWPVDREWLTAQNLLDRANAILECVADRGDQAAVGIDAADLVPPGADSAEVVDSLLARLRLPATPEQRALYAAYLDTHTDYSGEAVPDPFDPNDAEEVEERIPGLLWILAQHPLQALR